MTRSYVFIIINILCLSTAHRIYGQTEPIPVSNNKAFTIHSKILNESRSIWIHLPPNYDISKQNYPVLYLLDGEGHFKYASEMTDYLSGYDRNRSPEMIVVAIVNINRARDFTPGKQNTASDSITGNKRFLQFLQNELIPYVDKNYKTQPYRILVAHSLAGLLGLYAQTATPELFQAVILISPVIIYGENKSILNQYQSVLRSQKNTSAKLFITLGNEDTQNVNALTDVLRAYAPKTKEWKFQKYEDENHFSVTYKSMFDGIKYIYKDWFIDNYNAPLMSYMDFRSHFGKLSKEFGYIPTPPEDFINNQGYKQLRSGNKEEAIKIFKINVQNYPNSWNAYDSLGEAYMKHGDKELAIENYKKSISINPGN